MFTVGLWTWESKGTSCYSGRNWSEAAGPLCWRNAPSGAEEETSQPQQQGHCSCWTLTTFHFQVIYSFCYFSLKAVLQLLGVCVHAKSLQSCLTLYSRMDRRTPGSSVHGILQVRVGGHALLQGIFASQGSNLYLLNLTHWQVDSLPPAPLGQGNK